MKNRFWGLSVGIYLVSFPYVKAQWQSSPSINTTISTTFYDQQDARLVSDGKGGAIITWVDFRADALQVVADIYAQRIDKNGIVKWASNGVPICNLPSDQTAPVIEEDGAGGAIICWQDFRNGNRDLFIQRIDSAGNALWSTNGIGAIVNLGHQRNPKLLNDGSNGVFIVWEDTSAVDLDISAQHIDANGNLLWTTNGVSICQVANPQINPKICADGVGGAIICWQDKRTGVDYDIYAQRINGAGQVQWTTNGIPICTASNTQSNPKICTNNASGGAFIAWQDKRGGISYDVYCQSISYSGVTQWATNGLAICNANGSQSAIDMISENVANGAIVAWKDGRNGKTNIYAQRLNDNGTGAWANNGVLLSNSTRDQVNPNVSTDGKGGAIVVWQDSVLTYDIYAQKVDSTGSIIWTNGGVVVADAAANQTSPKNISDGAGGCIFSFQDKRSGDFDIYAHWLNADGIVGIEKHIDNKNFVKLFPNPAQNYFVVDETRMLDQVLIYNTIGEVVFTANNIMPGQKIFHGLKNGIYFVSTYSNSAKSYTQLPLTIIQ